MDRLLKSWTNPKNVENLPVIKGVLNEFRAAQAKVVGITKIIALERDLPATPLRKELLGMLADTRGTTAQGMVQTADATLHQSNTVASVADKYRLERLLSRLTGSEIPSAI
jgi:hypothetical protein